MTRRRFDVLFSTRATREIAAAETWWRGHRSDAAPGAIPTELARIAKLLVAAPALGAPVPQARLAGVRRILLDRLGYHLYYVIDADHGHIIVLAFWHVRRKPLRL